MKRIKVWLGVSLILLGLVMILVEGDRRWRVIFCDVGQGDGVLVTNGSFQMLVDTGPENGKMGVCLGKHVPFWDKKLELVVITHGDNDHAGGLKQIEKNYTIEQKIYPGEWRKNDVFTYEVVRIEVCNPQEMTGESNVDSLVMLLTVGEKKFLLAADIPTEVEQKMVWRNELVETEVLKISHHGSDEATSEELIEKTKPKEAVVSVGKNNRFGHPSLKVIRRLETAGVKIRRTDTEGDIIYECQE